MIALCLLLCGCGAEEVTAETLRQIHRETAGCEMVAEIYCSAEDLLWEGTLRCDYQAAGESTVEVIAPEIIAGVKAIVGEDLSFVYEGEIFDVAPLSSEELTPADCLPRMMGALREGWLLEENRETWHETECIRFTVDQSGKETKIFTTLWLRLSDGAPLRGETAVGEETIFTAEFTEFSFYDMIDHQEETSSGK